MTDAEWLERDALPGWFVHPATTEVLSEAEWLLARHPEPMLNTLRGRISDRKLRLFACACCRSVPDQLVDHRSRQAVEVAERFSEGLATQEELDRAHQAAMSAHFSAAGRSCNADAWEAARRAALFAAKGVAYPARKRAVQIEKRNELEPAELQSVGHTALIEGLRLTRQSQADLLREIVGNPFRPIAFFPSWRTAPVVSLARQMYESRDVSALPILADALQEAGCADTEVLAHCSGAGPHVRGCWVVDLALGKE